MTPKEEKVFKALTDEWLLPWEVSDLAGCPGGCVASWSTAILKKLADKGWVDRKNYDPGNYSRQRRVRYRKAAYHTPWYKFDCYRCKFNWNCGPLCSCALRRHPEPPEDRLIEINKTRTKEGCSHYEPRR